MQDVDFRVPTTVIIFKEYYLIMFKYTDYSFKYGVDTRYTREGDVAIETNNMWTSLTKTKLKFCSIRFQFLIYE